MVEAPPANWCHILAAHESADGIGVYVQIFVGPEAMTRPEYLVLGKPAGGIILPEAAWGHVFVYANEQKQGKKAGVVEPLEVTRFY